jgi:enoyl-CoA hydratase/carnithine racemase
MLNVQLDLPVAVVTISRPQRRNALGAELVLKLGSALRDLDRRDDIRAVLLEGSPPGFCAGSDLKELASMSLAEMCDHEADTAAFARSIPYLSKPVIAAVEGFAIGGGFALATSCDLVVTHPESHWHLTEVKIGWIPPWGLEPLTARVGPVRARRLTWGSEPINGTEAFQLGVVDYLAPIGKVMDQAVALGRRLAELPAPAVAATKRYYAPLVAGTAEARDQEANRLFSENCQHETAKATLTKFGVRI